MKKHLEWLISNLESWRSTFDNEKDIDNNIDGDEKAYKELSYLIKKLKQKKFNISTTDFENIIYHLWQKSDEA